MENNKLSEEVIHSIKTINKAYERSPKMAEYVINLTLPSGSVDDYNKMHKILEKSQKENCKVPICYTTIDNIRRSMNVLREEYEKNPGQVEATSQLFKGKGKSR